MVASEILAVDGVVLYRDDILRLHKLMYISRPDTSQLVEVAYRHQPDAVVRGVEIADLDLDSIVLLRMRDVTIDLRKNQLAFQIDGTANRRGIAEFYRSVERVKQPSRLVYLFRKPNLRRVELHGHTRAQARADKPERHNKTWNLVVAAAAVVVAIIGVLISLKASSH